MNRLLILPVLLLTLLVGTPAFSADFQKGMTAAQSGDYATALREWTPLAKQGNASAQFNLGFMYSKGRGVPQDYKTAVKLYKLAAEQGYANAQYNLGLLVYQQDNKTAVKWFRLAAEQGLARAQSILGKMYRNGHGVPQDNKTAVKWYRLAAEQGHARAQKAVRELEKKIASEKATPPVTYAPRPPVTEQIPALMASLKRTCSAIGFKDGSKEMSKCQFELYKLDQKGKPGRPELAEKARRNQTSPPEIALKTPLPNSRRPIETNRVLSPTCTIEKPTYKLNAGARAFKREYDESCTMWLQGKIKTSEFFKLLFDASMRHQPTGTKYLEYLNLKAKIASSFEQGIISKDRYDALEREAGILWSEVEATRQSRNRRANKERARRWTKGLQDFNKFLNTQQPKPPTGFSCYQVGRRYECDRK